MTIADDLAPIARALGLREDANEDHILAAITEATQAPKTPEAAPEGKVLLDTAELRQLQASAAKLQELEFRAAALAGLMNGYLEQGPEALERPRDFHDATVRDLDALPMCDQSGGRDDRQQWCASGRRGEALGCWGARGASQGDRGPREGTCRRGS